MTNHNVIRQSLKTLAPAMFLLLCGSISGFALSTSEPQELSRVVFKNSTVKIAISYVGKQMGLKVEFDDTVKDDSLSIELAEMTLEQGMKLIFEEKKLQARIIEEKTIIVFPDNEANRKKYEQYELWPVKSDGNK